MISPHYFTWGRNLEEEVEEEDIAGSQVNVLLGVMSSLLLEMPWFYNWKILLLYIWCSCLASFFQFIFFFPVIVKVKSLYYFSPISQILLFFLCPDFWWAFSNSHHKLMTCNHRNFSLCARSLGKLVIAKIPMWDEVGAWDYQWREMFSSCMDAPSVLCRPILRKCTSREDGINGPE